MEQNRFQAVGTGAQKTASGEPQADALKIFAKGFSDSIERRLLLGTVRISRNRKPMLELLEDEQWQQADVVLVDGKDRAALAWGESQLAYLHDRAVVWVDTNARAGHHIMLKRPVQWVALPIIIARALDDLSVVESEKQLETASEEALTPSMVKAFGSVLLVDDSLAVRNHLKAKLEVKGYDVTSVASGEEALEVLKKRRFACALMDVLMPGMDGYETCKQIKAMGDHKNMPILMLTSRSSPFDKIRGKMAGCNAYLTKPIRLNELLAALEKFMA